MLPCGVDHPNPCPTLRLLWIALLLLPNVTMLGFANAWDTDPVIVIGLIVVGADWHASVNVLELVAVANTFKTQEIVDAVRPYGAALALAALGVAALLAALWRGDPGSGTPASARTGLAFIGKWHTLSLNRNKELMHMDIVPTLLGAARIEYEEPRSPPVGMTSRVVPPRKRFSQVRPGHAVDLDTLRREAVGGPGAPAPAADGLENGSRLD